MQRTLSLRTAIIGAVVLALGAGGLIYALNQHFTSRDTGLFTVDVSEAANLSVEFFAMTPGGGSTAGSDWCEGDLTASGLNCVAKISNTTTTLDIDAAISVVTAAAGAGNLADDLTLAIYRIANPDGAVRDNCRAGSLAGWTQILAPTALSSLPAATPFTEAPGAANHLCFQLNYSGQGYSATPGTISTSANLSIVGTAQ